MKNRIIHFLLLVCYTSIAQTVPDIPSNVVVPAERQLRYQRMEMVGFIHFTVNTFTDKEWGYGDEDPKIFNPSELNVEQWVNTAKAGGMKELILTAKHHDGFCLWPSKFTEHSVKNSSYKNGKGDIVREFVNACRKHGMKVGFYLSPWDRNHKDYGKPEYITYYRNQIKELLTGYGEINEFWLDGNNGGDGYYGGAREKRKIDMLHYYEWEKTIPYIKSLQPNICIFSDAGPDLRWVGNEDGYAGETFWSTISADKVVIGAADGKYLNTGDPKGKNWIIGQCDVSIRPGWFYHAKEDSLVKSPKELVDLYYKSVGRNAVLLLNLPPNKKGLISSKDVASLANFRKIVQETFKTNLAENMPVSASNYRLRNEQFSAGNITDKNPGSYWTADDGVTSAELIVDLKEAKDFDRILLQEAVKYGQRISEFEISAEVDGKWQTLVSGTTIGYKRLLRIKPVRASKVKLNIVKSENPPAIAGFGLFFSSKEE